MLAYIDYLAIVVMPARLLSLHRAVLVLACKMVHRWGVAALRWCTVALPLYCIKVRVEGVGIEGDAHIAHICDHTAASVRISHAQTACEKYGMSG